MVEQKRISWNSILFVFIQFLSLFLIALTGPLVSSNPLLLVIEFIGIGLGVWAVLTMKPGHFNITPVPPTKSKLVKYGPYRFIRHPMYLALLLTTLPLIVTKFSVIRLLFWLVLLVDLLLKINFEEELLKVRVTGYANYAKESYRLIPFVY